MTPNTQQHIAQMQHLYAPSATVYSNTAAAQANSMHSPRYPPPPSLQHPHMQSVNSANYHPISQRKMFHDISY